MTSELKDCPHCGEEVELQRSYGQYRIVCPVCSLSTEYTDVEECTELVRRWNERYNPKYILLSYNGNEITVHGKYDSISDAHLFQDKLKGIGCITHIEEI